MNESSTETTSIASLIPAMGMASIRFWPSPYSKTVSRLFWTFDTNDPKRKRKTSLLFAWSTATGLSDTSFFIPITVDPSTKTQLSIPTIQRPVGPDNSTKGMPTIWTFSQICLTSLTSNATLALSPLRIVMRQSWNIILRLTTTRWGPPTIR